MVDVEIGQKNKRSCDEMALDVIEGSLLGWIVADQTYEEGHTSMHKNKGMAWDSSSWKNGGEESSNIFKDIAKGFIRRLRYKFRYSSYIFIQITISAKRFII